jgi:DNA-binding transcriptional regulator GbsR (MarR family)
MPSPTPDQVILQVADTIGGLMESWGFKRNMGRMWTVLYLSPDPLSAAQLAEQLSLSAGAVSMLLSELSHWGAVKRAWVPGERRDYYQAETNIWKMVSRVFRQRELRRINVAIETFSGAIEALDAHLEMASREHTARLSLALERIRGLRVLAETGARLLDSILSGEAVDASPLEHFEPE